MEATKVDHILRAAGAATGQTRFVLVGSAALFAWQSLVPADLAMTREVDLFAYDVSEDRAEQLADDLDASLGQASQFDQTFGYYCDGVGPYTAMLPTDWEARAKVYTSADTGGVTAIVPHPNDIAVSKLYAGREKDRAWLEAAVRFELIDLDGVRSLFPALPLERMWISLAELEERLKGVESRVGRTAGSSEENSH